MKQSSFISYKERLPCVAILNEENNAPEFSLENVHLGSVFLLFNYPVVLGIFSAITFWQKLCHR